MAKIELGTKRVCVSCGARFYDLTKVPAVCPKCATEQPIEQPRPRRTGGNVAEERRPKKPVPAPGLEEAEIEVEGVEEEAEEDLIEDAADLEDDADTIVPRSRWSRIPTRRSGSAGQSCDRCHGRNPRVAPRRRLRACHSSLSRQR